MAISLSDEQLKSVADLSKRMAGRSFEQGHFGLVHLELSEANRFVEKLHRHHKPVRGHRFSLGCLRNLDTMSSDGHTSAAKLVGVAIVGRPVARGVDFLTTLEVTRLCTDGTFNACSFLYGAAARAAKALGYLRIQTYILESERGSSLEASGYHLDGYVPGRSWNNGSFTGRREDQPQCDKQRWVRCVA